MFSMTDKTVIITGANGGLGFQCARSIALARQGWHIVIACRNPRSGEQAADNIRANVADARVRVLPLDLASLASVRQFITDFVGADLPPLRGLVCNAGMQLMRGISYTTDGFEITFGTNHPGHFLLTNLLLDQLNEPARIVVLSSGTHDPDTLEGRFNKPVYLGGDRLAHPLNDKEMSGIQRYSTAKLCNLYFAYELDRRLKQAGRHLTVNAFDPGAVPATNLLSSMANPVVRTLLKSRFTTSLMGLLGVTQSTPERSGSAMARLLLDPALTAVSGRYFQIEHQKQSSRESYDLANARDLWESSERLVGLG